jgi:alanine racemase
VSGSAFADRADDDRDAQAILTIDLDALGANWRRLAARAAPAECGAAVKADAYGIGIEAAVPALARAGCLTFFVAHASEGRRARAALDASGLGARIFVLNGFHPESAGFDVYRSHALDAVLGSAEELKAWSEARAGAEGERLPEAALHVDTGMNRLGFPVEDARFLSQAELAAAGVSLVMSHLVSAEAPADPANARQIASFDHARERALRSFSASLANSSGIFLPGQPFYDLVRPGFALYGGNPTPGRPNPMTPVVTLSARVLQLRSVPAGATAGYNARWAADRPSRLATIALGYADGLPIGGSGIGGRGAEVFVGDVPCPLVGRISMDLSIADVTHLPAGALAPGDMVEWLGPHMDVDGLAALCGTIGYEILVNLGRRHQRHYIGNGTGT